jgi:branched-chain amino acid transport system permease protein
VRPGRNSGWWIAASALLAVLPWIPGLDSNFARSLLTQMGIAAVFALSYNVLLGQTGLLSFGHAVYYGLGGYAAIHLLRAVNAGLPIPIPFVPLAGAVAGLAFGLLFGALITRRAGTIFALITLGVGELVHAASLMLPGFFGGEEGVTASRTKAPHFLGLDFGSQVQVYYVIAFWLLVSALAIRAFTRTPVGRMCNAVRDNPERAEFIGYNPQRVRFIAFAVAATFAGLAGGLHAINYEIVAAEAVSAERSGAVLVMVYIGGAGHFVGAILGAIAVTWLQVSLSDYTSAWLLYAGLFFMAVIVFAPGGLAGLVLMHLAIARKRAAGAVVRAYAFALPPVLAMMLGAIVLLEMTYRRSTQPEAGARMRLFWIPMDTSTPWPWIGALLAALGGYLVLRRVWPRVAHAWSLARD